MNSMIHKNFIIKGLFIALLPIFFVWAVPKAENNLRNNTKIGLDIGFGLPYKWCVSSANGLALTAFSASPNISLGGIVGYNFYAHNGVKLGHEVGLTYGFTRRLNKIDKNKHIAEKYLQIPIAIKYASLDTNLMAYGLMLGYELQVLLSSYRQRDTLENLKKCIVDFSTLSGSIFGGGTIDFPQGYYLVIKLKIPIEIFKRDAWRTPSMCEPINQAQMYTFRGWTASLLELSLGVDMMKWL